MPDEEIFDAICNALDIPADARGLVHRLAELDAEARTLRKQQEQEAWARIQRSMIEQAQALIEKLHALGIEGVHVEWERVDDA